MIPLFLLFLFSPSHSQSQCPDCKDVSGPGPLSGVYQLAGTQETKCQDLCSYEKAGNMYCFEKRQSEYKTSPCSCVACGEECLDRFEAPLYTDCGGKCQLSQDPCNGTCPDGAFLCGDICMESEYEDQFVDCDGSCQGVDLPCNNHCMEGRQLCVNASLCVTKEDEMFNDCNGECVSASVPCNGTCQNTTFLCEDECVPLTNTTLMSCNGLCQPVAQPCDGSCTGGQMLCNGSCVEDNGQYWTCMDSCIPSSDPCQDQCMDGLYLLDGECVEPCDLCSEDQCMSDSDCQDNAGCFLYGDQFFCQCYLGWTLDRDNASTLECPHTGTCSPATENGCEESSCYQADGVSVCPYCNATYGEVTYHYEMGSGFGFGGNISSPMTFSDSSNDCILVATWSCWYDSMEKTTAYSTVEIQVVSEDGCNLSLRLLSPLACPMAMSGQFN